MTTDISHPVRNAFQELGHRARVAATSAYVALPFLMASVPSVAYGHETGEAHSHIGDHWVAVSIAAGLAGTVIYKGTNYATRARSPTARFVAHAATVATLSAMAIAANYL
ncbi:MAG: hypothetical protein Q7R76_06040 [Candidatus Woesearchaeota archaeon]|nr:hypothetical protein [Candidatus Woesearchaeota archaeon]